MMGQLGGVGSDERNENKVRRRARLGRAIVIVMAPFVGALLSLFVPPALAGTAAGLLIVVMLFQVWASEQVALGRMAARRARLLVRISNVVFVGAFIAASGFFRE
jgi:hypothetical protein